METFTAVLDARSEIRQMSRDNKNKQFCLYDYTIPHTTEIHTILSTLLSSNLFRVMFNYQNTLAGTLSRGSRGAVRNLLTLALLDFPGKERLHQRYDTWSSEQRNYLFETLISTLTYVNKSTNTNVCVSLH